MWHAGGDDRWHETTPASDYVAPTWSWASATRDAWTFGQTRCDFKLKGYSRDLKGSDEFGEVSFLLVKVSCRLLSGILERQWDTDSWESWYTIDLPGIRNIVIFPDHADIMGNAQGLKSGASVICIRAYRENVLDQFLVLQELEDVPNTFRGVGIVGLGSNITNTDQERAALDELVNRQMEREFFCIKVRVSRVWGLLKSMNPVPRAKGI
jgi:hypothetical protein